MHPDRWEVGSEFHLVSDDPECFLPLPPDSLRYALAQHALIAIWAAAGPDTVLWIPDYYCPPVVDALFRAGARISRYADDPRWPLPRWNTLRARAGDTVLAVNYFGIRDGGPWSGWKRAHSSITLIEDHTHDPQSRWSTTSVADYGVASLRKTLPIPDGAIAWSPAGRPMPAAPANQLWEGSWMKLAAMYLKRDYLQGKGLPKALFRQLQLDGESALLHSADLAISPWSAARIEPGVPEAWRRQRERNVRRLFELTDGHPDFRPLFDSWPQGHCPFNAVFAFRDASTRDATRARLAEEGIYAAVHWPQSGESERVDDLARRILTIPVDQRYNEADVGLVAGCLLTGAKRAFTVRGDPSPRRTPLPPISPLVVEGSDGKSWSALLRNVPHDIYHTAAYHQIAERAGDGRAMLALVRDGRRVLAWPYLVREIGDVAGLEGVAHTDITSVYGYPGPIANLEAEDPGFIRHAWDELQAIWQSHHAVSAFTRFHPLLRNQRLVPPGDGVMEVGETVAVDVRMTDAEAHAAYPRVLRQEILTGRQQGLRTEIDESWTSLGAYARLYRETMERNGAPAQYFFDDAYFRLIRDLLRHSARLLITRLGSEIVAGGIFLVHGRLVHAHLVGTAHRSSGLSPLKVLLDDARSWAHSTGAVRLHLGGGRGGHADSLLQFKQRFSPARHSFSIGRWPLDESAYALLVERRADFLGHRIGEDSYFPAYRAGVDPAPEPVGRRDRFSA